MEYNTDFIFAYASFRPQKKKKKLCECKIGTHYIYSHSKTLRHAHPKLLCFLSLPDVLSATHIHT